MTSRVEIDHLRLEKLFAAEGEKLAGERGGLFARFANQIGVLPDERRPSPARRIRSA